MATVAIIVAVAENEVIGRGIEIPWKMPSDLRRFRRLTLGRPIIMGRKTYEGIIQKLGKPLDKRLNIVLTRQKEYHAHPGVLVVPNFEVALKAARDETAFVLGGAEVFRLAYPYATQMYLTRICATVEGDTFFPQPEGKWDVMDWSESCREDPKDEYESHYLFLRRRL